MEWSDLPFFLAVARTGQIARAAATLGTDATTVGRRVRRLERVLGERLFEQDARGQTLTPAGAVLLRRAEAMARIAGEIRQGTDAAAQGNVQGTIRVSVSEGFGAWFIARHIGELARRHPGLEVDLVANSGFLNPTRRETDLAILLARPRRGPLITRKLTDYRLCLYAGREYRATAPALDGPRDLGAHRVIGYIPDIVYAPELRYADELPADAAPTLRSSSITAQHNMIVEGAGVGILPCFIGDSDTRLSRAVPDIAFTRSFWLVTHRETHRFPLVRLLTDWLVEICMRHRAALMGTENI